MDFILKFGKKLRKIFKQIKKWALDSKLNMSILIFAILILILGIVICLLIIFRGGVNTTVQGEKATTVAEEIPSHTDETTMPEPDDEEKFTTEVDLENEGYSVSNPTKLKVDLIIKSTTSNNGICFTEYSMTITNITDSAIDGWAIALRSPQIFELGESWNAQYTVNNGKLLILPFPSNERLVSGQTATIGFVVSSYEMVSFNTATSYIGNDTESFNVYTKRNDITYTTENFETTTVDVTTVQTTTEEVTAVETTSVETTSKETTTVEETTSEETTTVEETTSETISETTDNTTQTTEEVTTVE